MKQFKAELNTLEALTPEVYRVVMDMPEAIDFKAGQYAQVVMGAQDKRPFSVASCPSKTTQLEFHIGATPDNRYAMDVIDSLTATGALQLEVPLGDAYYRPDSERHVILIAGGTGFSYTWSILQAHLERGDTRPITLYWGARKPVDLYFDAVLKDLAEQYPQVHYRPVVESADGPWHGALGLVHHAVLAEQDNLSDADVYVAGRFEMVRVIRDDFHAQGLPLNQLYGDALAFI